MDPIQLFVPTFRVDETLEEIRICLEKGWTGLGFKTVEFEEAWKTYTGLPYAHFLNSATGALHLAVILLKEQCGWMDGDEIITTPMTFVSTNHAILYEKLSPVFADVDETLCLDPASVQERITNKTRAVMYVGVGGNTGRLREIEKICRDNNLKLILDASHMSGTRWADTGKHVGNEADISIFSFQAVKNLPTGDSGMICVRDAELEVEARKWSWLGISKDTYARTASQGTYKWYYDVEHTGFKFNGNSIMGAIALVSLKYLEQDNAFRRQVCGWYDMLLKDTPQIQRIPMSPDCIPSRHLYQIAVDRRDEVMLALNQANIFPGVHYRDNTLYRMYAYAQETCPRSMEASDRIISLPLHLRLSYNQVEYICNNLKQIVSE
ncbi:MAG: DegT/DnrJ/EryC1/StrS family aminotransferase [Chitinophagaceae bacterium]|nr:DegT/DnrJ/EryC1/StrS family aminotransferase [Chitinophagaceae bacterium]